MLLRRIDSPLQSRMLFWLPVAGICFLAGESVESTRLQPFPSILIHSAVMRGLTRHIHHLCKICEKMGARVKPVGDGDGGTSAESNRRGNCYELVAGENVTGTALVDPGGVSAKARKSLSLFCESCILVSATPHREMRFSDFLSVTKTARVEIWAAYSTSAARIA